ncbi:MAG: hypothetical protein RMM06_08685 [Armatimonadota bacterium]|nr:hypothetical protein [Armatimonadota bacterium]MDW8290787.1 hypothetical protein [Armatimonadota bacterium]
MRRNLFLGCGALTFLALMLAGVFYLYWTAPPDVPVPPLPTPPDNAYPAIVQLAEKARQIEESTPQFAALARQATSRGADAATLRRFVAVYEPVRREYRQLIGKPSVVTNWNSVPDTMQTNAVLRSWARVEAADIELALREGDYARAVDDLRTVLLLVESARRGGTSMHHLTGEAMIAIATETFLKGFDRLPAAECEQLVRAIREWEQVRVPYWQALEGEKRFTIAMYHAMYEGGKRFERMMGAPSGSSGPDFVVRAMNLRAAAREAARIHDLAIAEARKPLLQRQPLALTPKHPLNQLGFPALKKEADKSLVTVTRLRLLACAAAVRAYRMRQGRYPRTLAEAGVTDLNRDPITGGEFMYRTGEKGFLLYSVGADGKDDGGKRVVEARFLEAQGDLSLRRYDVPNATPNTPPGAAVWWQ